jgi:hypothetical protein
LVISHPGLDWARRCSDRLLRIRPVADPLAAPLAEFRKALSEATQACIEAAPLVREGENRAFASLETLAWDLARSRLEQAVSGAQADAPEQLRVRREEVTVLTGDFDDYGSRLEKELSGWGDKGAAFRQHHPSIALHADQSRGFLARLPVDLKRIDEIAKALFDPTNDKGLWGKTPRLAQDYEEELQKLESSEGTPLSRESRRKLGTCLLFAGVSRLLYSGLREEEIAAQPELRKIGRWLGDAGGPVEEWMTRVSPKVRDVVGRLKP